MLTLVLLIFLKGAVYTWISIDALVHNKEFIILKYPLSSNIYYIGLLFGLLLVLASLLLYYKRKGIHFSLALIGIETIYLLISLFLSFQKLNGMLIPILLVLLIFIITNILIILNLKQSTQISS